MAALFETFYGHIHSIHRYHGFVHQVGAVQDADATKGRQADVQDVARAAAVGPAGVRRAAGRGGQVGGAGAGTAHSQPGARANGRGHPSGFFRVAAIKPRL